MGLRHPSAWSVGPRAMILVLLVTVLGSCSGRDDAPVDGMVGVGVLTFDGADLAEGFFDDLTAARRTQPLPPVARDAALDELAGKGLQIVEAGLPEGVSAIDHLIAVAGLPAGLEYGVGFEEETPGLDDRVREAGARSSGVDLGASLMAADPALQGFGWAAGGPWAVVVFRARPLTLADGPALLAGLRVGVQGSRPQLRIDDDLSALAAEAVSNGVIDDVDHARWGRAGGVPVTAWNLEPGAHLPLAGLSAILDDGEPGTLGEPWLAKVGVSADIAEGGAVLILLLATGEADRGALAAQLVAAEPKATELVNRSRAEAGLPAVQPDPRLVEAARQWVAEAARQGCYVAYDIPGCAGTAPKGADLFYGRHGSWRGADDAFTWNLTGPEPDERTFTRFGAAATLAPDGTIWAMVAFAR